MLEPDEAKVSRPVLRGPAPSNGGWLLGTVKKSIAAIASRWSRRKASQRLAGSGFLGARFIQREMVLSD